MVKYPQTLDDDESLFLAVNNLRTLLTLDMNASVTTAEVVTTSGFPSTGYVSILSTDNILETEAITYSGTTATEFLNLARGSDNTSAVEHSSGSTVDLTIVAQHHNELKDAIIVLEEFVGASGATNFVPKDQFGNVLITGTLDVIPETVTISGELNVGYVTVTGTVTTQGGVEFRDDAIVSGTLNVGELPVSTTPIATYAFDDSIITKTSTVYSNTGITITPETGWNLVFFRANAGEGGICNFTELFLRVRYSGATVAEVSDDGNAGGPWDTVDLAGFKLIDADGTSTVTVQGKLGTGSCDMDISSQQLISIPLEAMALTSGTDYWFHNGVDTDFSISDPPDTSSDSIIISSVDLNVPVESEYLIFGYGEVEEVTTRNHTIEFFDNGSRISGNRVRTSSSGFYRHFAYSQLITLTAGAHTITAEGFVFANFTSNTRRCRICVLRADSFNQIIDADGSQAANVDGIFTEMPTLTQEYTPNLAEQVLVIGYANSRTTDATAPRAIPTYKIRDNTTGTDYATDFGGPIQTVTPGSVVPTMGFAIKDGASALTEWQMYIREANSAGNSASFLTGNLVIWSLATDALSTFQITIIDGDGTTTPTLTADNIVISQGGTLTTSGVLIQDGAVNIDALTVNNLTVTGTTGAFEQSLTVSGIPVNTGGGGGGASTLQEAYDNGDGTISTTGGKPVELTGTGELTAITGTFSAGLTVGESSTFLNDSSITTGSGIFTDSVTVAGSPLPSSFVNAITVSGLSDITGTIDFIGSAGVNVSAAGNTVTFDGSGVSGGGGGGGGVPDPLELADINATNSLTVSGVPVSTGIGEFVVNHEFLDSSVGELVVTVPQHGNTLAIHVVARSTTNTTFNSCKLTFNGDDGGNYTRQRVVVVDNATVDISNSAVFNSNFVLCGDLPGTQGETGSFSSFSGNITNYSSNSTYKGFNGLSYAVTTSGATVGLRSRVITETGMWRNTDPITTLTFSLNDEFAAGSTITVKGF